MPSSITELKSQIWGQKDTLQNTWDSKGFKLGCACSDKYVTMSLGFEVTWQSTIPNSQTWLWACKLRQRSSRNTAPDFANYLTQKCPQMTSQFESTKIDNTRRAAMLGQAVAEARTSIVNKWRMARRSKFRITTKTTALASFCRKQNELIRSGLKSYQTLGGGGPTCSWWRLIVAKAIHYGKPRGKSRRFEANKNQHKTWLIFQISKFHFSLCLSCTSSPLTLTSWFSLSLCLCR